MVVERGEGRRQLYRWSKERERESIYIRQEKNIALSEIIASTFRLLIEFSAFFLLFFFFEGNSKKQGNVNLTRNSVLLHCRLFKKSKQTQKTVTKVMCTTNIDLLHSTWRKREKTRHFLAIVYELEVFERVRFRSLILIERERRCFVFFSTEGIHC